MMSIERGNDDLAAMLRDRPNLGAEISTAHYLIPLSGFRKCVVCGYQNPEPRYLLHHMKQELDLPRSNYQIKCVNIAIKMLQQIIIYQNAKGRPNRKTRAIAAYKIAKETLIPDQMIYELLHECPPYNMPRSFIDLLSDGWYFSQ